MTMLDELLTQLRNLDVKLWVEGDRLRYRAAKDTLTPDLLDQIKAHKSEIVSFLSQVSAANSNLAPIVPVPREESFPLSFTQERLWLLNQLDPNSPAYNIPIPLRLEGAINLSALEQSFNEILRRHEVLRTTFQIIDGQPRQVITPNLEISIHFINLDSLPTDERETAARNLANEEAQHPFDITQGPLVRVQLIRISEVNHILMWNIHSIVCDGSSADIFFQELISLYRAFATGQPSPLADLLIQYADFVHWQRHYLQGDVLNTQLQYWRKQLGGHLPTLQLPVDHIKPITKASKGDRCFRILPKALNQSLNTLSQQAGTTLFMTLLAAFKVLLCRYSGNDDILISFANAGRSRVEIENLIGFFGNTLILRTNLSGNPTFRDVLNRVKDVALGAYAHQDLPFERLVEEIRPERYRGQSPLFQVTFALNPPWTNGRGMATQELPGATIQSLFGYVYSGSLKFDLALVMRETDEGLRALFEYNTELFESATIVRLLDCFQTLLESLVAYPERPIFDLPILSSAEQHRQLIEWNTSPSKSSYGSCIHQVFEAQVAQTPNAVALVDHNRQLTYQQLNAQANQLAHYLQQLGVTLETHVGVYMSRSADAIVASLAILKAGGSYVPLPESNDLEYLNSILNATQTSIVLTQSTQVDTLTSLVAKIVPIDTVIVQAENSENPVSDAPRNAIALISYSTRVGHIHGFGISHCEVLNLVNNKDIALTNQDRLLQHSPLSCSSALFEIWSGLLKGAQLVIAPNEVPVLQNLNQLVRDHQISSLWLPTRWFQRLTGQSLNDFKSLHLLLVGGDVLTGAQAQAVLQQLPNCKLIQTYTAPDRAGFTCIHPIVEPLIADAPIPIGRPLAGIQTYILDTHKKFVPTGVIGELHVGGATPIQVNFDAPNHVSEYFIPHPFNIDTSNYLYKTGDLARHLDDGTINLIDRSNRLSINQNRPIETSRIEAILSSHPDIQECLVTTHRGLSSEESLVAYIVWQATATESLADLCSYLKQNLPTIMIPSAFVRLDEIPLTLTGEVDYFNLPQPELAKLDLIQSSNQPLDDLELKLTQIWQDLLGVQSIDIHDNFFELGGHSLLAVRLFSQIEKNLGQDLPLSVLLQAPTIAQLANLLRPKKIDAWSPLVEIQDDKGSGKLPLFCIHGGGFNVLVYRSLAINLEPDQPVFGLQARGLQDGERIADHLEEMAADYIQEIRQVQPKGSYLLSGLSNGGNIALEMAQQLQKQGEEVALLAMFDTYGPNSIHLLPPIRRFLSSLHYLIRYTFPRAIHKWRSEKKPLLKTTLNLLHRGKSEYPNTKNSTNGGLEEISSSSFAGNPSTRTLEDWMNWFSQYVLDHSPWAFLSPETQLKNVDGSLSERLKKLEASYAKAHKSYVPKPYPGEIILFMAQEPPPGYYRDSYLGWRAIATKGIQLHSIPGHHTSLMESPVLAEKMRAYLEIIQAKHLSQ
jgi:aspartate racemase